MSSIATYAQVGRLDTLPENKRNEILLKAAREKLIKQPYWGEYYSADDIPIILDLGVWKEGDHVELGILKHKALIGRRLYAVIYPASEESLKYYPGAKNIMIVIFDAEDGVLLFSVNGISPMSVKKMKEHRHRKDSINLLRLKYLEKERCLKEIEDSISRDNGGRTIK